LKDLEQMTSEFEKIMMSELADDEAEDSRSELQAKKTNDSGQKQVLHA